MFVSRFTDIGKSNSLDEAILTKKNSFIEFIGSDNKKYQLYISYDPEDKSYDIEEFWKEFDNKQMCFSYIQGYMRDKWFQEQEIWREAIPRPVIGTRSKPVKPIQSKVSEVEEQVEQIDEWYEVDENERNQILKEQYRKLGSKLVLYRRLQVFPAYTIGWLLVLQQVLKSVGVESLLIWNLSPSFILPVLVWILLITAIQKQINRIRITRKVIWSLYSQV